MKIIKKLFVVLFVCFASLAMFACGDEKEVNLYDEFMNIYQTIETPNAITENVNLPTTIGDIEITWLSENPDVISNTGVVTRQKKDTLVKIVAIFKLGDKTERFYMELTVKAYDLVEDDYDKIGDVLAGADGTSYEICGTVVAVNAQSFLVQDSTGMILVYKGYNYEKDLAVGDVVVVSGASTTYAYAKQFGQDATYTKKDGGSFTQPTPKELTAAEVDAYSTAATVTPIYVKVNGVLSTSKSSDGTKTYYNLDITGATLKGSITYPVKGEELELSNNKTVEVIGYVTGVSGSSTKYLNLMITSIKVTGGNEPGGNDAVEKTIGEILTAEAGLYKTTGVVVGVNAQSFLLKDSTGIMLVYKGFNWNCDVVVGDKLAVTGTSSVYALATQFGQDATYEKVGTETVTQPNAKELTAAEVDAYANETTITPAYVKLVGTLTVSSGKYFNLNVEGATAITGSITYPADAEALKALDGKKIEVVGYVTGISSSKYLNILFTEYKEVGATSEPEPDLEPVEKTIGEVLKAEAGSYIVSGMVVAINAQGFVMADGNDAILVYKGKDWTCDVVVGDKVKVTGTTSVYSKAIQFGKDCSYEKTGSETYTAPTATVVDGAKVEEIAALDKVAVQYVKVEGVLSVSGNYYNVTFNGTTIQGSITYPVDTESLAAYNGKGITIEGYFTGITVSSSAGKTFFNIVGVNYSESDIVIEQPEPEPDPEPNPNPNPTEGVKYDFVTGFASYASGWDTNYIERVVNSSDLGADLYTAKFTFSRADKQNAGQAVDDRPVIATNASKSAASVYVTIEADFSGFSSVSFELKQWSSKTFDDIHIEFTTDGTTWTKCSASITTPGVLTTNADITGAVKVRLVVSSSATKNVQLGLTSITLGK